MDKKQSRLRRARRIRGRISTLGVHRLSVYRTSQHIYAQIIAPEGDRIIACANTLQADIKAELSGHAGNVNAAVIVGKAIAVKAKAAGLSNVAFDRSGYKYHGRIKALADAARENGLQF